jgi:hypothetical protein
MNLKISQNFDFVDLLGQKLTKAQLSHRITQSVSSLIYQYPADLKVKAQESMDNTRTINGKQCSPQTDATGVVTQFLLKLLLISTPYMEIGLIKSQDNHLMIEFKNRIELKDCLSIKDSQIVVGQDTQSLHSQILVKLRAVTQLYMTI